LWWNLKIIQNQIHLELVLKIQVNSEGRQKIEAKEFEMGGWEAFVEG
jgi:hypothetical protein